MLLADMAYRSGRSQNELRSRFLNRELLQILAHQDIDMHEKSKDDIRFQLLAYWIVSALTSDPKKIDPKMFEFKWDGEDNVIIERSEEDMVAYAENLAKLYGGKVKVERH